MFTTPVLSWSEIWNAAVSFVSANGPLLYPILGITVGLFLFSVGVSVLRRAKRAR